jgi:peptidyl-tRNA hydrolase
MGFRAIDFISEKMDIPFNLEKKKTLFGKKRIKGIEVVLLKPQTFSNLSAEAVLYIASLMKVEISDIFLIFDDIHRSFGEVAIEKNAAKITHNAVTSLADGLQSHAFVSCALGVGPLPQDIEEDTFYLSNFNAEEEKQFPVLFNQLMQHLTQFLQIEEG